MHILTIDRLFTNNLFSVTFYEQTSGILFYLICCKLLTISADKPKYTFTNRLLFYINSFRLTFNNHRIIPHTHNTSASDKNIFNGSTHCAVKVVHIELIQQCTFYQFCNGSTNRVTISKTPGDFWSWSFKVQSRFQCINIAVKDVHGMKGSILPVHSIISVFIN